MMDELGEKSAVTKFRRDQCATSSLNPSDIDDPHIFEVNGRSCFQQVDGTG